MSTETIRKIGVIKNVASVFSLPWLFNVSLRIQKLLLLMFI